MFQLSIPFRREEYLRHQEEELGREVLGRAVLLTCVPDPDLEVFGPPGSGSICQSGGEGFRFQIRILATSSKNSKKTLDFYCFVTLLYDFLSVKNDGNDVPSKSNKHKTFFFNRIRSWIRRSEDPIHTKMSGIRNTAANNIFLCQWNG
jgi:hypothetical protein